jgi:hypothetical protein
MSLWEFALSSSNPKYWFAGYQANRYGLEKIGMIGMNCGPRLLKAGEETVSKDGMEPHR